MKKGIWMLIIGLCSLSVALGIYNISFTEDISTPDSGYDYDYGGGGGYSGGGSSYGGGSSSYDHDYDYGGSSGSYSSSGSHTTCSGFSDCGGWFFVIFVGLLIGIPIITIITGKMKDKARSDNEKRDMLEKMFATDPSAYNTLIQAGIDPNYVLQRTFQIYSEVQYAWSNFDYNLLRKNLSDELYNEYAVQLDTMRIQNERNVMSDISQTRICIKQVTQNMKEGGLFTILVRLGVTQKDYRVNLNNPNYPMRGDTKLHDVYYELVFEMTKERENHCPQCGAKIDGNVASQLCPYCGSVVVAKNHDLIMLKKKCLAQNVFYKR